MGCERACSLVVAATLVAPQVLGSTPSGSGFKQAWAKISGIKGLWGCCSTVNSQKKTLVWDSEHNKITLHLETKSLTIIIDSINSSIKVITSKPCAWKCP